MKKLLGLLVISGAVLCALFFLTNMSGPGGGQNIQALTLTPGQTIQEGSLVSIEYTLKDDAGKVIESNVGKEPLAYVQGAGQIVRGLEKELAGLKVGAQKTVTVKAEEGYGAVNPNLIQEFPKEKIPADSLKVDAMLVAKTPQGAIRMRIKEIKDKTVVVDLNNPLAGKTLVFDVRVMDIKEAAKN